MRKIAIIGAAASIAVVPISAAVHAVAVPVGPDRGLPDNDHARGMVFDGLNPGRADGQCGGGFEIDVDGVTMCTHGPDAAEGGIDVRTPRATAELQLATLALPTVADTHSGGRAAVGDQTDHDHAGHDHGMTPDGAVHEHADGSLHDHGFAAAAGDGSSTASEIGIVPVIGDGVGGNRVQAVYAVAADQVDRYDEIAPLIANWAAHIDAMMSQSAALTGGERHVRFVTNPDGTLNVAKVILPVQGDDSFGNTIQALKAEGHSNPARKYLMWVDASLYCGIGTIYGDDKPTQDNYNNGLFPMYSRVDTGCWGKTNSVELHEIVHNMGGVQKSSPHVTPGWHCTDDYDRMCYRDSSTVTMTYQCEAWMEAYLDCGHDDYFHTSPPAGSYLDTHWNVADSSFLHAGPPDGGDPPPPPPPPVNEAPTVSVAGPSSAIVGDTVGLDGTVTDDGLPGPYTVSWTATGPGSVSFTDVTVEDTVASFWAAGTYVLTLTADDGESTGSASVTITVDEPAPPNAAPSVTATGPLSIVLGDGAVLDGAVSDDGRPGPYAVGWSQASGPGVASFANPASEDTSVSFSAAGDYVLTLTADDGELTGSASVTITVDEPAPPPPVNEAPTVSLAGPSSAIVGDTVGLDGTVTDDALPGPYTVSWTATGPGSVSFTDAAAEDTLATFSAAGTYVLTLTADDGESTGSASVTITVDEPAPPNTAPSVTATGPGSIVLGDGAVLDGTVTDNGQPGPYTVIWTATGPGAVSFTDAAAEDTVASFSAAGTYVVTLTADDGELTGSASVTITVAEPPPPDPTSVTEVFEGSISRKWPVRTYETTVADGPVEAALIFGKSGGGKSGGGKGGGKAQEVQMTVVVLDDTGVVVASATGPSVVQLSVLLSAGTYTWEVSGTRTSFSLEVTYLQ